MPALLTSSLQCPSSSSHNGNIRTPLHISSLSFLSTTLSFGPSALILMASGPSLSLVSAFFLLVVSLLNHGCFSLRAELSSSIGLESERGTTRRAAQESSELWCVAKNNAEDGALQQALDWVCGLGGVDCGPIQQSGACYEPSDIQSHASYAFNDYFHKNLLDPQACVFGNTAALTALNPSHGKCIFPSSVLMRNGSFTGSATQGPSAADSNDSYSGYRWVRSLVTALVMLSTALIL